MSWIAPGNAYSEVVDTLPGIGQKLGAAYRALWTLESVPAETLELCRLRLAQQGHDRGAATVPVNASRRDV